MSRNQGSRSHSIFGEMLVIPGLKDKDEFKGKEHLGSHLCPLPNPIHRTEGQRAPALPGCFLHHKHLLGSSGEIAEGVTSDVIGRCVAK